MYIVRSWMTLKTGADKIGTPWHYDIYPVIGGFNDLLCHDLSFYESLNWYFNDVNKQRAVI